MSAIQNLAPRNCVDGLDYEVVGNGNPIVFLHGLSSTHHEWIPLANALAIKGYQSYMPDLFGHGCSPRPNNLELYTAKCQVQSCMDWLAGLVSKTKYFTLIGHSFGGFLSLHIAASYGKAVHKIILINPLYSVGQFSKMHALIFAQPKVFIQIWRGLQWIDASPSKLKKVFQISQKVNLCSPYILNTAKDMTEQAIEFRKVMHKTLLIWGDKDKTLNPLSFAQLLEQLPNATGYRMPGCGHVPHIQNPYETNRAIINFLES